MDYLDILCAYVVISLVLASPCIWCWRLQRMRDDHDAWIRHRREKGDEYEFYRDRPARLGIYSSKTMDDSTKASSSRLRSHE
jgi:hypothetical protein